MHNSCKSAIHLFVITATLLAHGAASGQDEFSDWNLEPSIDRAHLVMVARVDRISRIAVVEGAKTDVVMREYRFQPIRVLKGIFQRDQLLMTASDLGCPSEDVNTVPPLTEGEFRLLILAQQSGQPFGLMGCVAASPGAMTFEQRVPLVKGPNDSLVGVVETLIKVADSRSRRERAKLLVDRLAGVDGIAAIPLLTSLKLRADLAVADERVYASLAGLIGNPETVVRGAALDVLEGMLSHRDVHREHEQLDEVAAALQKILNSDEAQTKVRVVALEALGHLLASKEKIDWAQEFLQVQSTTAVTHAERAAAAKALSRISSPATVNLLADLLTKLPLDEQSPREETYVRAAAQLSPFDEEQKADGKILLQEQVLLSRLKRSIDARQSLAAEIDALGEMSSSASLPLLLLAASQPNLAAYDRHRIAWALGRLRDHQAVPVLVGWMRSNDRKLKEQSLAALERIDSQFAAQEARPLLKSEANLPYKLRLARILARHGFADGYALATEHLADDNHTAAATLLLAALNDARTADDLSQILSANPDRRWHGATLSGLAGIGDAAALRQLREILGDDRHPLVVEAAIAAGLAPDSELLLPLAKLVQSRNKQIAISSLVSLRRFLSGVRISPSGLAAVEENESELNQNGLLVSVAKVPVETRSAVADAVAALAVDSYVDASIRQEALSVARLLGGEGYSKLLSELADQAELEGTPLMAQVQKDRHRTKRQQP